MTQLSSWSDDDQLMLKESVIHQLLLSTWPKKSFDIVANVDNIVTKNGNNVEATVDLVEAISQSFSISLKLSLPFRWSQPSLIHGSFGPHKSPPKWHLDQLSRFCRAHERDPTDRHTHRLFVSIGHVLRTECIRCNLIIIVRFQMWVNKIQTTWHWAHIVHFRDYVEQWSCRQATALVCCVHLLDA